MGKENVKERFSKNLVILRRKHKLTQGDLADKLSYSDKTISKWENGDALPDAETLCLISEFFDVSVDELLKSDIAEIQQKETKQKVKAKTNKLVIALLAVSLVWFIAIYAFVQVKISYEINFWMAFLWAVPASCVVLFVFNLIWGKDIFNYILVSVFDWSFIASLFLQILPYDNVWPIFFLGIPVQVAVILWSKLKVAKKKGE